MRASFKNMLPLSENEPGQTNAQNQREAFKDNQVGMGISIMNIILPLHSQD